MKKAFYEALQPGHGQSFLVRVFDKSAYNAPYHFHPEFELTCILAGSGKRYVGSHMDYFTEGDLVLLGSNLPHCWKLNEDLPDQKTPCAIVLQFDEDFLGDAFLKKEEMHHIHKLLAKSNNGISFRGNTSKIVNQLLENAVNKKNNFDMLIDFLQILQILAISNEYKLLDNRIGMATISASDQERLYAVWAYIVENFRNHISLQQAADLAHMTTNAFCKYFKKVTKKTFIETVLDYRLSYAIQQLTKTDKPVSQVALESGYGDVSQFHKNFKANMNMSPLSYRKQFLNS